MQQVIRLYFLIIICIFSVPSQAGADQWNFRKGAHFIVQYAKGISDGYAMETLREAERYYDTLTRQIGYSRYHKFWTWDQRVKIVLYADQKSYVKATGLPAWSRGGATQYHRQLRSRAIVSFHQEKDFHSKILPHEISHLLTADFFGSRKPPLWFNEGIAQLHEQGKLSEARRLMSKAIRLGYVIPLKVLLKVDIRFQPEPSFVMLYYAQSVSIVDFLLTQYGSRRFQNLCRYMREGLTFEKALPKAYTSIIGSVKELEEKWLYSAGK